MSVRLPSPADWPVLLQRMASARDPRHTVEPQRERIRREAAVVGG